jgi:putative transposase
MARPPRLIDPNGLYHFYDRGNNRNRIFTSTRDYEHFLEILVLMKRKFDFSLFHYCLMPNHFHLLIRPNSPAASSFMHGIKNSYAKYFCTKYDVVGHVWQGRYKNKHVETDEYLFAVGNYIELNPVRGGLVSHPADWRYSSYRFYAYGEVNPLIEKNPLYPSLGRTEDERRSRYRNLIDKTRA